MAGFSLDETILATVIDGFHRGNNWSVATGASATKSSTTTPEKYFRMSLIETIRRYAKIVDSSALLEDPCNLKSVPLSAEGI